MGEQPAPPASHDSHWYPKLVGEPDHEPVDAASVSPSVGVAEIAGSAVFAGGEPTLVPVPVRPTVWGVPAASSEIDTVPLRGPVAVGVNVTEIVQLPAGATAAPVQVSVETAKSPLAVTE